CFDLIGYPPSENGATLSFTYEQIMKLMNLINDVPSGNMQANMAGWIIDSRANQYIVISTLNMFRIIDIFDLNLKVGHPNRTLAKIKYVGNLKLFDNVVLFDVLVVLEYCLSLLVVWIYLVKTKDEVYGLFVSFINQIHNQFKCNIKNVRYDNGTKFVNNKMSELFNSLGIVHQTSCAYTPHQNGVVESKHMHLLNVARSLLFQSGIPLKMWTECILTAAYLINMLHSSVLNGKSPFELVYGLKQKLSFEKFWISPQTSNDSEDNIATSMGDNIPSKGNVPSSSGLNTHDLPGNESQVQPAVRRSSRSAKVLAKFNDYVVGSNAIKNTKWIEAMNNEIEALNRNNIWTICDLPKGRKPVGSKWLFKIKYKSTCEIERYKARLVAKGFSQREGFDYLETFSLVVNMSTVRCMVNVHIYDFASHLESHLYAALRVLRYIKGSLGSGIQINKNGNLKLRAYADSAWARCHATRKSVSGYCVFLGESLVTWKSKKQSTLSKSSADAEYRSMASAACEIVANLIFLGKSKHFEIDVHLVREKVGSGVIKIKKIHTSQQIADVLTKALDIEQYKVLCEKLGVLDMFKVEKLEGGC
ncbi:ribonuclease H-like domain-containing protein, partial [Tanacetum coccineum]